MHNMAKTVFFLIIRSRYILYVSIFILLNISSMHGLNVFKSQARYSKSQSFTDFYRIRIIQIFKSLLLISRFELSGLHYIEREFRHVKAGNA